MSRFPQTSTETGDRVNGRRSRRGYSRPQSPTSPALCARALSEAGNCEPKDYHWERFWEGRRNAQRRITPPIASQKTYISEGTPRGGRRTGTMYTKTGIPVRIDWCTRFFVPGTLWQNLWFCYSIETFISFILFLKGASCMM